MNILYLALIEIEIPSGPTIHTLNLMKGFQHIGTNIRLLCPKPTRNVAEIADLDCSFLPFFGYSLFRLAVFNIFSCFYLIYQFITYKPTVLYLRDRPGNIFPIIVAKLFRIPFFIEMNGVLEKDFQDSRLHAYMRFKQFSWTEGVIFNCPQLCEKYSKKYSIPKKKSTVITMHVDCGLFKIMKKEECRKKLNISKDAFVIGYVGGFSPRHDVEILKKLLLKLEKQTIKAILLLVGDTKDISRKEIILDGMKNEQIIITGWIAHSKIPLYINAMDVGTAFVKESEGNDSASFLKIKEYLACGVPIILNSNNTDIFNEYMKNTVMVIDNKDYNHIDIYELSRIILEIKNKRTVVNNRRISELIHKNFNLKEAAKQTILFFEVKLNE